MAGRSAFSVTRTAAGGASFSLPFSMLPPGLVSLVLMARALSVRGRRADSGG